MTTDEFRRLYMAEMPDVERLNTTNDVVEYLVRCGVSRSAAERYCCPSPVAIHVPIASA